MSDLSKVELEVVGKHYPETLRADDEIDLIQLWLILAKRKLLIGVVCLLCLCAGLAFAFLVPLKFTYTTSVEIGTTLANNGVGIVSRKIEAPEAVIAKLKESYAPLALTTLRASGDEKNYEVKVQNPKKSNLIVLSSKGPVAAGAVFKKLHHLVLEPLLKDHRRILDVPKKDYEISSQQATIKLKKLEDPRIYKIAEKELQIQIESAKMRLTELDDAKNLLISQGKRLAQTQTLLRSQISKVEKNLAQAQASRAQAAAAVSNESQAMTMLLITNQIEQHETRLSALQERLNIGLENKREVLHINVAQNRRAWELQKEQVTKIQSKLLELRVTRESAQAQQRNVVSSIENEIGNLQATRILGEAVRSLKPTGPGKALVLALSAILGLMAGILFAFFAEFMNKVNGLRGNN